MARPLTKSEQSKEGKLGWFLASSVCRGPGRVCSSRGAGRSSEEKDNVTSQGIQRDTESLGHGKCVCRLRLPPRREHFPSAAPSPKNDTRLYASRTAFIPTLLSPNGASSPRPHTPLLSPPGTTLRVSQFKKSAKRANALKGAPPHLSSVLWS